MARPIVMPSLGMYTAEGTLTSWLKEAGSTVAVGEIVAEITTEKATYEIEAPVAGTLHPAAPLGATLAVQGVLGYILAPGEAPPATPAPAAPATNPPSPVTPAATPPSAPSPPPSGSGEVRATPVARRLAAQHGVSLTELTGSGPGGRIVEADVQAAIERATAAPAPPQPVASPPTGAPSAAAPATPRVRERIPLIGVRRTIAERLRYSLATAVPVTLTREVEAEALVAARAVLSVRLGQNVPYDALFSLLLARALRELPTFNATIENETILVFDEIHIGFAVATSSGLLVPVLRAADQQPLAEMAATVTTLSERARAGRLTADEMSGGTATITNLGAAGVDAFTPILNPPQSVILGIGRIQPRPALVDGQVALRATTILSLTFDHRVADGAPAAALLAAVARLMNDRPLLDALA